MRYSSELARIHVIGPEHGALRPIETRFGPVRLGLYKRPMTDSRRKVVPLIADHVVHHSGKPGNILDDPVAPAPLDHAVLVQTVQLPRDGFTV